jgi:quinol monooxygenase YgiN
MLEQIVRIYVSMTVSEDQLSVFQDVANFLTEGSKQEPGTLGYEWFAATDGTHYRLVENYENAAAVEAHFDSITFERGIPRLVAACHIDAFEIYGDPGPKVTAIAGGMGAVFFAYKLGLDR